MTEYLKNKFKGVEYEFIMGSDVVRDGMYLELEAIIDNKKAILAEVFYSDVDNNFYLSCHEAYIPLSIIDEFIAEAKIRLPPTKPLILEDE